MGLADLEGLGDAPHWESCHFSWQKSEEHKVVWLVDGREQGEPKERTAVQWIPGTDEKRRTREGFGNLPTWRTYRAGVEQLLSGTSQTRCRPSDEALEPGVSLMQAGGFRG